MKLTIPLLTVKILIDCIKTKYKKNYDEKKFNWIIDMVDDNFLVLDVFSNRKSRAKNQTSKEKNPNASWMIFFDSTIAVKNYLVNSIEKGKLGVLKTVPTSILLKHSNLRNESLIAFEKHLNALGHLSSKEIQTLVSNVSHYKTTLFDSILDIDIQKSPNENKVDESDDDTIIKVIVNHSKLIPHSEEFADWLFSTQVFIIDSEAIENKNGNDRLLVADLDLFVSMFETNFMLIAEEMCSDHSRFDRLQKYFNSFFGLPESVYDLNIPEIVFKNIPKMHIVKIM